VFFFAIFSIGIYVFVKTETNAAQQLRASGYLPISESSQNLDLYAALDSHNSVQEVIVESHDIGCIARMADWQKKVVGVFLSILSGCLYGLNYDPVQYLMDRGDAKTSRNGLDYAFSHYCGIYLTSTVLFLVYLIWKRNNPWVNNRAILPSLASGALWAIAQSSFFVANSKLQMTVSFPIISIGPGVVAALWGIFVFGEIRGTRNYLILAAAFFVSATAVALITLSKILNPDIF